MVKLPDDIHPALRDRLMRSEGGALASKMGIELLELSAEYSVARSGSSQSAG